jgi:hypothetical protein
MMKFEWEVEDRVVEKHLKMSFAVWKIMLTLLGYIDLFEMNMWKVKSAIV